MAAQPLAMYYAMSDARGLESIAGNLKQMTLLGTQCYTMDNQGIVRGAVPQPLADLAREKQLPLMPLVVNPGFNRSVASTMLRSPKLQERTASYLAYLANRENYVGWQLDLESIDPADKTHYTAFVRRVAAKLHRDGRLLSVAVVPRFSDSYPDARDTEFRTGEWGAAFDFRALGQIADFIVLMTYDQHTSGTPPGPVAGHDWIEAALHYAANRVPPHKLLMGIPFYGREWVETSHGSISRSMTYDSLRPLIERPEIEVRWDARWRAPWIQYREQDETHTVWFDDRRSYTGKLELVRKYRLRGFAAWRLGTEDPLFWVAAAELAKALAKPAVQKRTKQSGGMKPRRALSSSR